MKISVIIPLYNQKQFVGEAIESVLAQEYSPEEIIVVDDGSTDDPTSVLGKFGNQIQSIRQENKGLAAARNTGLRHATGEYIQFLDADDLLAPGKLQRQVEFLNQQPDLMSCYCNCIRFQERLNNTSSYIVQRSGDLTAPILNLIDYGIYFPIPIHTALIRRKLFDQIGYFSETLCANEDREFWVRAVLAGILPKNVDFEGVYYRKHGASMNVDPSRMLKGFLDFSMSLESLLKKQGKWTRSVRKLMAHNCFIHYEKMKIIQSRLEYQEPLLRKLTHFDRNYCPGNIRFRDKLLIKTLGFDFYFKHFKKARCC